MQNLPSPAPALHGQKTERQKLEVETAKELRTLVETKIKELLKGLVN